MIRSYRGLTPKIPETRYVDQSAQLIGDVELGEHASVWMNAVLRGDVHSIRVGHYSNIQDCSVLHGMKEKFGVFLGDYVTVGHSVTLHGCTIEDRCLIGMGSIVLNGARIGSGSIIAAGTLIPEGTVIEPNSLWMGSPGKFRRKLGPAVPCTAGEAGAAALLVVSVISALAGAAPTSSRSLDSAPRNRVHSCSSDFLNIGSSCPNAV